MISKIAVGVFLGILAAFMCVGAFVWLYEHRKEVAKKKAEEISYRALYRITPEAIIARCGTPLKDTSHTLPSLLGDEPKFRVVYRELFYKGRVGTVMVSLTEAYRNDGEREWNMDDMKVYELSSTVTTPVPTYSTDVDKIRELPC